MSPASASIEESLAALVEITRHYGQDPEYVLAGGGNTSFKTDDRLFVKGSGHAMATIGPEGFVELDRRALDEVLDADLGDDPTERESRFKAGTLAARVRPELGQRPSVESLLHNLLPGRFVVHTHPTAVNAITCCTDGEAIAKEVLGEDVLWVRYVDPGYTLARSLREAIRDYAGSRDGATPPVIVIQNHGLFVLGENTGEIVRRTEPLMASVRKRLEETKLDRPFGEECRIDPARARELINVIGPALRGALGRAEHLKVVTFDDSPTAMSLAAGADGPEGTAPGPVSPDHLAYTGSFPLWVTPQEGETPEELTDRLVRAVAEHEAQRGLAAIVVLVKGLGLFAVGDDRAGAERARVVYLDQIRVLAGARGLGGVSHLSPACRQFIEGWEVEKYRLQVAAASAAAGRAGGKVALVTGAARGFGLEIAQDLAEQGAHVVLADVNAEGAAAAAEALCEQHGPGRAIGLAMDVTDASSVADALHRAVREYGGLDVFVSNAGVLKADSVKTQPPGDFEFVTRVNYTGYFLCVQNVSPILALQRRGRPAYWSDIIQINSKSGLVGSNRNAAYAGGKFGGIGLTQSFALELVDDGIKVNAICPGNFYDGPLWSDPENGLFVQYLRAGKVPGAETIQDVRRAYEAKAPIGRGCTTADVMKAIYYLIEQTYETGQALPVTGGQVMLN